MYFKDGFFHTMKYIKPFKLNFYYIPDLGHSYIWKRTTGESWHFLLAIRNPYVGKFTGKIGNLQYTERQINEQN